MLRCGRHTSLEDQLLGVPLNGAFAISLFNMAIFNLLMNAPLFSTKHLQLNCVHKLQTIGDITVKYAEKKQNDYSI
jgi:hypothetical protein